jgi:hypothetical protein
LYNYCAYGLGIRSELPLPELLQDDTRGEVLIRLGKVECASSAANDAQHRAWMADEGTFLYWESVGTFLIRGGAEIIVDPSSEVTENRLRLFLLGAAMGVLLYQRGLTVLHGSAISLQGDAVAFRGGKGWGKSTMAATFHSLGHSLITDDVIAIRLTRGRHMVLPGFPQLKLWPDSAKSLGHILEGLPRLHPRLEKRSQRIGNGFARTPVPLKCIYLLGTGPQIEIEPLYPKDAWAVLMSHWYGARFGKELLQAWGLSAHFLQCVNLAKNVSVCRLNRPPSLSALPDVAHSVQTHLTSTLQQAT